MSVTPLQNSMEPISLPLGQEPAARQTERGQTTDSGAGDTVSIDENAFKRRPIDLSLDAQSINFEQAMQTLDFIKRQSPEALGQAHGALDSGRVFQLLGLSE